MKFFLLSFLIVFLFSCRTFGLYIYIESVNIDANPTIGNVTIRVQDHSKINGDFHIFKTINDVLVSFGLLNGIVRASH